MKGQKRDSFYRRFQGIIDAIIAAIIYTVLAFSASYLVHYLLRLDKQTFFTVIIVVFIQGVLGFLTFIVGRHIEKKRQLKAFEKRTNEHHRFVHKGRDLVVKMYEETPIRNRQSREPIVPASYNWMLERMLLRVANTFQLLVPSGTKVFAAIRERQRGNLEDEYVTILRAGNVDADEREKNTKPILKSYKMVDLLWKSFFDKDRRDCVLLTGSEDKDTWENLPNDDRGEDLSVLLGAVFSKRWNLEKEAANPQGSNNDEPIDLEWILCVAADKEGAFTESHKNLMKCFNDMFGLLVNIFLRQPSKKGGTAFPQNK
jgi:hypothetical protein